MADVSGIIIYFTVAKLILTGGGRAGLTVADIVSAVTSQAGLDGEAVRDVLVLDAPPAPPVPLEDEVLDAPVPDELELDDAPHWQPP